MKKIKEYILKRLGIITLKRKSDESLKRINELEKKLGACSFELNELKKQNNECCDHEIQIQKIHEENTALNKKIVDIQSEFNDFKMHVFEKFGGINTDAREKRLIVSLTSFPARIEYVSCVIERMLMQTYKPDEIILWLSKDQFEHEEEDLPDRLVELKKFGLKIEWVENDIKAYKKFIYAMQKYTEDLIVILDDDLVYDFNHLETLYQAHCQFPDAIIASRTHAMKLDEQGNLKPYKQWDRQCPLDTYQIKDNWFFTGGAGTLFPPHVFDRRIFDEEVFMELSPWADDIWLNIHAAMNHVPIINTAANCFLRRIDGSQEVTLQRINLARQQNDVQLKAVVNYYKENLKDTIYSHMN